MSDNSSIEKTFQDIILQVFKVHVLPEINYLKGQLEILTNNLDNKEILNSNQAASFLNISQSSLYYYVQNFRIPFYRKTGSNKLTFKRSDLIEWINAGKQQP